MERPIMPIEEQEVHHPLIEDNSGRAGRGTEWNYSIDIDQDGNPDIVYSNYFVAGSPHQNGSEHITILDSQGNPVLEFGTHRRGEDFYINTGSYIPQNIEDILREEGRGLLDTVGNELFQFHNGEEIDIHLWVDNIEAFEGKVEGQTFLETAGHKEP